MVRRRILKKSKDTIIPLTSTEKIISFINENFKLLLSTLIIILICIIAFSGFILYKYKLNNNSYIIEYKALKLYRNLDIKKNRTDIEKVYLDIIKKYKGTKGSKFAQLYLGNIYFKMEKYNKAIDQYKELLKEVKKNTNLYDLAIMGLGYSYEALGDYKKSIAFFKKITEDENNPNKVHAYMAIGRCYEGLKDYKEAIKSYISINKEFPTNTWKSELINKIEDLKAKI
ncbi:MAG TPA: tetratricopeptide repeat protein [Nitrospinota bacterium]|nr:tetratricopeptide repeat protein [Nitrospinota bacterium]